MQKNASSIQYPPQTGPYKVFVKDKGLWQKHNIARLQISVGNPKHDGDKFFALAEWAAARFDHVVLIVSDTLQRHNIALQHKFDVEKAYDISLKQGDYWLAQNRKALDILPSKTITRWNDWINHPDYRDAYNALCALYANNANIRSTIDSKACEFAQRRIEGCSESALLETSIQYILEEVPAFALMFRSERAIDVYPGDWFNGIFEVLRNINDIPFLNGFEKAECLRVDFVRNKTFGGLLNQKAA